MPQPAPGPGEVFDSTELLASMTRDFAHTRDIEATLLGGLGRIIDYIGAVGGAVFVLDDAGETLTCTGCVGGADITGITLKSDQGIVGQCVQNNVGEIVRDAQKDPRFYKQVDEETGFVTKSILCAPLSVNEQRIGAIELVNKGGRDPLFNAADLHVLETMSSAAALAILNARMAEQLVEQERVRRELELAAEIQRSLLPDPPEDAFPVHGVNYPARLVSGDFYDFFALADGRICFNLGDVSGKGMNAALLMAKTASLYRCLGKEIAEPGRLLARINDEICETATRGMFVTMIGGVYDPRTGRARIANAGHEPPLLYGRDGRFTAFPAESPPLGIVPMSDGDAFPEIDVDLDGGALYVFTDGVTEGFLEDGSTLEVSGLKRLIRDSHALGVADRLDAVIQPFNRKGVALRDDVTVLAIDDGGQVAVRQAARTVEPAPPETGGDPLVKLRLPAQADRLRMVRTAVAEAARLSGCSDAAVNDLVLAVDEACQNVIRHAYGADGQGDMVVEMRRRGDDLVVLLRDFADPVDVATIRPRDLDDIRPGGLGTYLMSQCLDEVGFLPPPDDGGNLLRMVKRIG